MASKMCQRDKCGGFMIDDGDGPRCNLCGRPPESDTPADQAASVVEPTVDSPPSEQEAAVTDVAPALHFDELAFKTRQTEVQANCRKCEHHYYHDENPWCDTRACSRRLSLRFRLQYRPRLARDKVKIKPLPPDAESDYTKWSKKKKLEVCKEARATSCKAVGKKYGVPAFTIRSWIANFTRMGRLARAPDPGDEPEAFPIYPLPKLPEWKDDWPAPVQVAWLSTYRYLAGERK